MFEVGSAVIVDVSIKIYCHPGVVLLVQKLHFVHCTCIFCCTYIQSLPFVYRFTEFHLALAQVDLLSGKHSECQAHLNTTRYLLQSEDSSPGNGSDKQAFFMARMTG